MIANPTAYRIIGIRPDGLIGIRQFSNSQTRADQISRFVREQHRDWQVQIEVCDEPGEPLQRKRRSRRKP